MPPPERNMKIEKLLQIPKNRVRWMEMIKRQEEMRTSWNDRAKEVAQLVEQMKEEQNVKTTER